MDAAALVFDRAAVLKAITPERAIESVREGFVRHAAGEWSMPPKVYLDCTPHGDFRAMPAAGAGIAIVKWVTSFPSNAARGLPTVIGTILVSDATTGRWLALVDGGAVTALRTGAAAAIATQALARSDAQSVGIVGFGLHGTWAARCLAAAGYRSGVCADIDDAAARFLATELAWATGSVGDALACDVVTLVTPGHSPLVTASDLRAGMHINALGADGPSKAELDVDAVARCVLFCDEWHQASHGGELTRAVTAGLVDQKAVTELGAVLAQEALGRSSDDDVTLFDSTGLAIQDLAIVLALLDEHRSGRLEAGSIRL